MKSFTGLLIFFLAIGGFVLLYDYKNGFAMKLGDNLMTERPEGYPVATLAGGCFWCVESEFRAMNGVLYTIVGYTQGELDNPTYKDITTGKTGHVEAIEVVYDPDKISYEDIVLYFLTKAHDPTQLNRQGVDVGTQYRSGIYYHSEEQKQIAEKLIEQVNQSGQYKDLIVTEIKPADTFWVGEEYHQQYYEKYQEETGQPHIRVLLKQKK